MLHSSGPLTLAMATGFLYLDPGSGSLLLQVAIAAILAVGIFVRLQWSRIKKWLGAKSSNANAEEDEKDE